MMRVLCGELGYRPAEVYGLLYCEACIILDGHRARLDREREQERWGRAHLVSMREYAARTDQWLQAWELLGEPDPNPANAEREQLEQERSAVEMLGGSAETPEQVLARFGLGGDDGGS